MVKVHNAHGPAKIFDFTMNGCRCAAVEQRMSNDAHFSSTLKKLILFASIACLRKKEEFIVFKNRKNR
jgi:hypothetical protein